MRSIRAAQRANLLAITMSRQTSRDLPGWCAETTLDEVAAGTSMARRVITYPTEGVVNSQSIEERDQPYDDARLLGSDVWNRVARRSDCESPRNLGDANKRELEIGWEKRSSGSAGTCTTLTRYHPWSFNQ